MACISQGGDLNCLQDIRGGANGARRRDRNLSDCFRATWFCEEKKAISRLLGLRERAQGTRVIRDGIQSAIRTNREDETVSQGRGRGTFACTQNNDERKCAFSCP